MIIIQLALSEEPIFYTVCIMIIIIIQTVSKNWFFIQYKLNYENNLCLLSSAKNEMFTSDITVNIQVI